MQRYTYFHHKQMSTAFLQEVANSGRPSQHYVTLNQAYATLYPSCTKKWSDCVESKQVPKEKTIAQCWRNARDNYALISYKKHSQFVQAIKAKRWYIFAAKKAVKDAARNLRRKVEAMRAQMQEEKRAALANWEATHPELAAKRAAFVQQARARDHMRRSELTKM